jgi:hypothetical protein
MQFPGLLGPFLPKQKCIEENTIVAADDYRAMSIDNN